MAQPVIISEKIAKIKIFELWGLFVRCLKIILLRFKEFHGLHDDLKIIWKTFNPWPHVQKIFPSKKTASKSARLPKKPVIPVWLIWEILVLWRPFCNACQMCPVYETIFCRRRLGPILMKKMRLVQDRVSKKSQFLKFWQKLKKKFPKRKIRKIVN